MVITRLSFRSIRQFSSSTNSTPNVLVLNCGSSSIKFQVLNPQTEKVEIKGQADRLNSDNQDASLKFSIGGVKHTENLQSTSYMDVTEKILDLAAEIPFKYVGHRVVHGGELFCDTTEINDQVLQKLKVIDGKDFNIQTEKQFQILDLAPLHNPIQRMVMGKSLDKFPLKRQAAVFDTSYHSQMLPHVFRYAVPDNWYHQHAVRRYGFHGTSHDYVVREFSKKPGLKVISCHLGAGCSVSASVVGEKRSRDTSMGFTPLSGVMMGTRSGDIDPTIFAYMSKRLGISTEEVLGNLNNESGFLGISGTSDSRDLEDRYQSGDLTASLTIDMFCYQVAKTIASYVVPLQGIDAIIFTGGIGEKSFIKREKIVDHLKPLGAILDQNSNNTNGAESCGLISTTNSSVEIRVIKTNEELMISRHVTDLFE